MKASFRSFGLGAVLALSVVGRLDAGQKAEPWVEWSRNPLTIPVTVLLTNLVAESNTTINVTLADGGIAQQGYGCTDQSTNTAHSAFSANLGARREYLFTVVASNFTSVNFNLEYKRNWTPLSRRGRAAQPKAYQFVVDREVCPDGFISAANTGGACSAYSNTWTIELTERLPANWRQEDGSDDATAAPGDGKWAELGPGKSLDKSRAALSWSVALGRLMDGSAAGRLSVRESGLSREIYTPTNIFCLSSSGVLRDQVDLITQNPNSPVLRQVKAYQTFVDIVAVNTNSTEMRFYLPSQVGAETNSLGHYTQFTGDAFVVWALTNPEPATTNKLNIVEGRNNVYSTNEIVFDPNSTTATWALKYGKGSEQRVETRGVTFTAGAQTNRVEVVEVREATNLAYRATEKYRLYPWGFELVETLIDPDNNPGTSNDLVTTITFNEEPGQAYSYGKPDTMIYPDGYWEKRLYDDYEYPPEYGLLRYVLSPDRDSPSTPAQAEIANSIVRQYRYDLDTGQPIEVIWSYQAPDEGYLLDDSFRVDAMYRIPQGSLVDASFDGASQQDRGGSGTIEDDIYLVGIRSLVQNEGSGFGYYGHSCFRFDNESARQVMYTHGGTYNSANRTFSVSANEIWEGPDFRECVVFGGDGEEPWDEPDDGIVVGSAQSQSLYDWDLSPPLLNPNRSWREARIFQKGSVVQRDMHVFTGVDVNGEPIFAPVGSWVYENDALGHATNVTWYGGTTDPPRVIHSSSYKPTNGLEGDLLMWEIDEQGIKTSYTYDSQKRKTVITKEGIGASGGYREQADITTTIVYDACGRVLSQTTSAGGLSFGASTVFDLAGRPRSMTDTNGLTTTIVNDLGGRRVTKTLPDGSTEITENYLDRHLHTVSGTGVVSEYHDWNYTRDRTNLLMATVGYLHTIRSGSPTSARERSEGIDWVGRVVRYESPDWVATNKIIQHYSYSPLWSKHIREVSQAKGSVPVIQQAFMFDTDGSTNLVCTPVGDSQWWYTSAASAHRFDRTATYFKLISGSWFRCSTNFTHLTNDDATRTFRGARHERLNGFSSASILSEVTTWDADTNATIVTVTLDRSSKKVTEVTDPPFALNATNITINGLLQSSSTFTVAQPVRYAYDALGRQTGVTNTLGFASTTAFNSNNQVQSTTDFTGLLTTFDYYANGVLGAGQLKCLTVGGLKKTWHSYTNAGRLYRTWGDVPYPEERLYSPYGELVELRTFRGGTGWNQADWPTGTVGAYDKTVWTYQEHSGLLASKTDAKTNQVEFTYLDGLLKTRKWARGVMTTNTYNQLGELTAIDYSDGTVSVAYTNGVTDLNRQGQPRMVEDSSGVWRMEYDYAGRLTALVCTNGAFNGITVSNRFNTVFGRDRVLTKGSSWSIDSAYGFDAYGRLSTVTRGSESASYGYLANSDLLSQTANSSDVAVLTTTRTWDYGSRLRSIANTTNSVAVVSYAYIYDGLGRRTQSTLADGSWWSYGYDDRDEVTSGKRYWSDFSAVAGQQFEYGFDNIGNRTVCKEGGDRDGLNLRAEGYGCDGANQYTVRTNSDQVDVVGAADPLAAMTVSGAATARRGEYFDCPLSIGSGSTPVAVVITNTATLGANTATLTGSMLVPPKIQSFTNDLDGNLTGDGLWTYTWDAENRLKSAETSPSLTNWARCRLDLTYDHQGRRVTKTVQTNWTGSAYQSSITTKFVYDSWNLIAEINASGAPVRSYVWGLDLSGTPDGAGGIGGLLMVKEHSDGSTHFPAYDGNGNLVALVKTDKAVTARYEYGPFGELIRASKPFAKGNPFRLSTKYCDEETGLLCYGYRYYSPSMGRWMSRDPSEEDSGLNLYGFVGNNPINRYDRLGLVAGDDDWDLDLRLAIAAEGSGFVATYAYSSDLVALHNEIMENGIGTMKEAGKEIAWAVGMQLGGGMAGSLIGRGLTGVAQPVMRALSGGAADAAIGSEGITVLGRFPAYLQRAKYLGGRAFNIPIEIWSKMAPEQQWAANQKFLDRMIARGDKVVLSAPFWQATPGTSFAKELQYLLRRGYKYGDDGWTMVR